MGSLSQKSSFQSADTPLVSTPKDDPLPSPITPAQHVQAISILKDEDDATIFAWLMLARSLQRNLQNHSDHACLTRDQVRAIADLRHCKTNDVCAWLHLARTPGVSGALTVSASPPLHNWVANQTHAAPSILSEGSIPGPFDRSSNDEPKQYAVPQNFLTQPSPAAIVPPSHAKPKYCCTLCGYLRPFKHLSDWRKHEREHDTTYICMLKGPREATPQGAQCAFCGILNPHDDHLLEHNAQACLHGPPRSFSSKRRHEMVNHLGKIHNIHPKSQGEAIAMKWKYTVEKQAWSCGFCGDVFVNFNDRLSHIATQHFERGHTIDDWDATNVIQGLLRQSGMTKAWEQKLASLPAWKTSGIMWERDTIADLQHDLEVGPNKKRTAVDLAEAAYIACRMNLSMEYQQATTVAEAKSNKTLVPTPFLSNHFQAPLAPATNFAANHYQSLSATQESNEVSPRGLASTPIANSNNSNNLGFALSTFYPQQTLSATRDQNNDNSRHGDHGNDKEEHGVWSRTPGSIYETEFDTVFNIDDRGA